MERGERERVMEGFGRFQTRHKVQSLGELLGLLLPLLHLPLPQVSLPKWANLNLSCPSEHVVGFCVWLECVRACLCASMRFFSFSPRWSSSSRRGCVYTCRMCGRKDTRVRNTFPRDTSVSAHPTRLLHTGGAKAALWRHGTVESFYPPSSRALPI